MPAKLDDCNSQRLCEEAVLDEEETHDLNMMDQKDIWKYDHSEVDNQGEILEVMGPETRLPERNSRNGGSTIYGDDTSVRTVGKSLQILE